jgi:hypothetical protein
MEFELIILSKKYPQRIIMVMSSIILTSFCDNEYEPSNYTEEEMGKMTLSSLERVNDYPLYVMTYYGDYGFYKYLKTGQRASLNITPPNSNVWRCTCFSGLNTENFRIFGRNFDWLSGSMPLLLFTDPTEGFASVSVVDLNYFGYNREKPPDLYENRENLLDTPWMPFDGLNEKGVAIGMMAVPHAKSPYDPSRITLYPLYDCRLIRKISNH